MDDDQSWGWFGKITNVIGRTLMFFGKFFGWKVQDNSGDEEQKTEDFD
jgi:predicted enzyme related to lactoylglutathione lyase